MLTVNELMASIYETLQHISPFAFPVLWLVPVLILFFRFRAKQVVYLRRFPPIDRYQTLDMYTPWIGNSPGTYKRLNDAMWKRQDDPDLEHMRREVWRTYGLLVLWGMGFPIATFGVITLLILTGHPPTA